MHTLYEIAYTINWSTNLTLILREGIATTPPPNSFHPSAQKHAAKG